MVSTSLGLSQVANTRIRCRHQSVNATGRFVWVETSAPSVESGCETMRHRCYSELRRLETFEERFDYLQMVGQVGDPTFGYDRWANQQFYASPQWQHVRNEVILRDNGCDLGVPGYEVHYGLLVHHMNPMTMDDIGRGRSWILDPEFLICTSKQTHNALHYGGELPRRRPVERRSGDTKLW